MQKNNIITLSDGFYFPKPFLYLGYACIVIGIISTLFDDIKKGLGIIAVACFVAFTPCGVQINVKDKLYRKFVSILGIKTGKWKSLKAFKFITLEGKHVSETTYGGSTPISTTTSETYHDLYLLSDRGREKLTLKRFKDVEKAKIELENLSDKLGLEIQA